MNFVHALYQRMKPLIVWPDRDVLRKTLPMDFRKHCPNCVFDIQESVGLFCSTIKIPAFTKGKKQLSGIEVEQTRRIANVRIHVERVIGNIRKNFSILSATQPIDFVTTRNVTTLDQIVTISFALVNIFDSVVPFE